MDGQEPVFAIMVANMLRLIDAFERLVGGLTRPSLAVYEQTSAIARQPVTLAIPPRPSAAAMPGAQRRAA